MYPLTQQRHSDSNPKCFSKPITFLFLYLFTNNLKLDCLIVAAFTYFLFFFHHWCLTKSNICQNLYDTLPLVIGKCKQAFNVKHMDISGCFNCFTVLFKWTNPCITFSDPGCTAAIKAPGKPEWTETVCSHFVAGSLIHSTKLNGTPLHPVVFSLEHDTKRIVFT